MSTVTFESVLRNTVRRIKRVTKGNEYEGKEDSFITTGKGIIHFISENYEKPFPNEAKFPYNDFPIFENEKYILVSTLDTEILEESTMSSKTYSYLISNRNSESEYKWSGLNLYYGKGNRWIEIYDDTCGLHYSTFILFA